MDDRLGELLQFGQGNPFMDVPEPPQAQEPVLDEFFNQIETLRREIQSMRGLVLELKDEYAATLTKVLLFLFSSCCADH